MPISIALVPYMCLAQAARASDGAHVPFFTLGLGMSSCATWGRGDFANGPAGQWIAGFWSGLNAMNDGAHLVGARSDYVGIVAEVERLCSEEPSRTIVGAVIIVYKKLAEEGR